MKTTFMFLALAAVAGSNSALVSAQPQDPTSSITLEPSASSNPTPIIPTEPVSVIPTDDTLTFNLEDSQNFFAEAMRRVEGLITGQGIDIQGIIALGTGLIQRIQRAVSDPKDAIKQGTELVDAIVAKLREKNVEAGTVFAVEQSLKGALNIADAIIPPKEEKKMKGCWLGEFVRLGKVPTHCSDPEKQRVGLQCLDKCPEGFKSVGPLCWRGLKPKTRGKPTWTECKPGHTKIAGLCYEKPCGENFDKQFGAMCIATKCPPHAPKKCGRLCLSEGMECGKFIGDMVDKGKDAALEAAQLDFAGAIGPVADMIRTLASFPQCYKKP
ncbi:hypothetical protein HK102_001562 [Quaeritorhiza haematococci]|nr:hypothetical protein HK102_001562 [Quaeritorhiza haematococci]